MSLLGEIKRRNVIRVALAYAVIAWLLVQIVVTIEEPLNLPGWTDTLVIVLLALGFPVALVLSWVYDLTASGLVRDDGAAKRTNTGLDPAARIAALVQRLRETPDCGAIIARGHLLLWLVGQDAVSSKLEAFNVSIADLEARLRDLLARIPRAHTNIQAQPTRSVEHILSRAAEVLEIQPATDPVLALWQAVAEETCQVLDSPDAPQSPSDRQWRALIAEVPRLEQAVRGDTLYFA